MIELRLCGSRGGARVALLIKLVFMEPDGAWGCPGWEGYRSIYRSAKLPEHQAVVVAF
jgi:hypothetical protein